MYDKNKYLYPHSYLHLLTKALVDLVYSFEGVTPITQIESTEKTLTVECNV